jgi:hypothetical protein
MSRAPGLIRIALVGRSPLWWGVPFTTRICLLVCAAAVAVAHPAFAQVEQRVSLTVKVALDPSLGGNVTTAGHAVISGVPATFTGTRWSDSHSKNSPLFVVDVGHGVGSRIEVLGGFEYGRAGADLVTVGTVPSGPLSASFDTYQFWGLEGGVRFGLRQGHGAYGVVNGGFRRVSDMSATFTATGLAASRAFYDGSAVPTFGLGGGFIFGSGDGFGIGLEVAVKYAGSLTAASASPELSAVNTAGERWSLPVSIVLRF